MVSLIELRNAYLEGRIEKKIYWQLARENYMHILPEIQEIIRENEEIASVTIEKDGVILLKKSGVKNYFDFTQSISRPEADILMEGDPEKDDMEYIHKYLSDKNDYSVLDIGANVGIFSLDLYRDTSDAVFYLFEPIPTTYEWLVRNASLNGVDSSRYKPFNLGMSDKKGQFVFYVPASNEAASLVANEDEFYRKRADAFGKYTGRDDISTVDCYVDTVDNFVSENSIKNIAFIKIDVEGNEKKVLEGSIDTLKNHKPLVYCELLRKHAKRFGYHPNDVIKYMKDLGYECGMIVDNTMVNIGEITEKTEQTNFFFYSLQ